MVRLFHRHTRAGFTLVELIIVIVILGILSVAVAPRFVDVSGDAKAAVVKSLAASIETSARVFRMKYRLQGCDRNHRNIDNVSVHFGTVYAGDWDIVNTANCNYSSASHNGLPEIMETLAIDENEMADFWMLHIRNAAAPLSDELYIAPFPPDAQKGVWQVSHASPANNASDLIATQCYVRYSSARYTYDVQEQTSYDISGC